MKIVNPQSRRNRYSSVAGLRDWRYNGFRGYVKKRGNYGVKNGMGSLR